MSHSLLQMFLNEMKASPASFFRVSPSFSFPEQKGWPILAKNMLLSLSQSLSEEEKKQFGSDLLSFLFQARFETVPGKVGRKYSFDLTEIMFLDELLASVAKVPWTEEQMIQMASIPLHKSVKKASLFSGNFIPWKEMLSGSKGTNDSSTPHSLSLWRSSYRKCIRALRPLASVSEIAPLACLIPAEPLDCLVGSDTAPNYAPDFYPEKFFLEFQKQNLLHRVPHNSLGVLVHHLACSIDEQRWSSYIKTWFDDSSKMGFSLLSHAVNRQNPEAFHPNDGSSFSSWPAEILYQWKSVHQGVVVADAVRPKNTPLGGLLEGFSSDSVYGYLQMACGRCSKEILKELSVMQDFEDFLQKIQPLGLPEKNQVFLLVSLSKNPLWSSLNPARQTWVQEELERHLSNPSLSSESSAKTVRSLASGALALIWHRQAAVPTSAQAEILSNVLTFPCAHPTPLVDKLVESLRLGNYVLPDGQLEKMEANLTGHQQLELVTASALSNQSSRPKSKM